MSRIWGSGIIRWIGKGGARWNEMPLLIPRMNSETEGRNCHHNDKNKQYCNKIVPTVLKKL